MHPLNADIDYFYENLNNTRFWNWKHPLEGDPLEYSSRRKAHQSTKQALKARLNIKVLEGFKK